MNPKFRDLQIQAFAECKSFEDGQFRTDEVFERFAELIVERCALQCVHNEDMDLIEKHFGVKE